MSHWQGDNSSGPLAPGYDVVPARPLCKHAALRERRDPTERGPAGNAAAVERSDDPHDGQRERHAADQDGAAHHQIRKAHCRSS
jgi:hypothetical protein